MSLPSRVTIVEVGPRDGLQNEPARIAADDKIAFVDLLSAAGLPVIEVSSFVRADWVPQLADAGAVIAGIARRPGTRYTALVPNFTGLKYAEGAQLDRGRDFRRGLRDLQPAQHQPQHRRVARVVRRGVH